MKSETIGKLAEALSKAQGKITGALKDSANPFYKSKYADLAACWEAARGPLSENGLAVIQTTELNGEGVTVITTLAHSSGEWMAGKLHMTPTKPDPQGIGSCITYARRYALAAIVGLAQIDDDANSASGVVTDPRGEEWKKQNPKAVAEYTDRITKAFHGENGEINDTVLRDIMGELAPHEDLKIAVWARLKKSETDYIKALVRGKAA